MLFLHKGCEVDESDGEWDEHIAWRYGSQVHEGVARIQPEFDTGIDVAGMLTQTFELNDRLYAEGAEEVARAEDRGPAENAAEEHDRPPSPMDLAGRSDPLFRGGDEGGAVAEPTERESSPVLREAFQYAPPSPEVRVNSTPSPPRSPSPTSQCNADDSSDEDEVDWGDLPSEADALIRDLEDAAATPLFAGSEHSSMGATYVLVSGARLRGCTDTYIDYLFRSLSSTILPQPNTLPRIGLEAAQYLKRLGHTYKSYNVCPNSCCLFRGNLADAAVLRARSERGTPWSRTRSADTSPSFLA